MSGLISLLRMARTWLWIALLGTMLGSCQPTIVTIGALLSSPHREKVFRFAVDYVNQNEMMGPGIRLDYILNRTDLIKTFENIQLACRYAEMGVMAVVGPSSSTSIKAVSPITTALRIPHIAPTATDSGLANQDDYPFLVRMLPPDSVKSRALIDLVDHFGWTRVAILTSNTDYGIHGLVAFQALAAKRGWTVVSVQQFQATNEPALINATFQLQLIRTIGVKVVLLNCLGVFARRVMEQASHLGMTQAGYAWIVTDMDRTIPASGEVVPYLEGLVGMSPSTGHGALWADFAAAWNDEHQSDFNESDSQDTWEHAGIETTFIVDAVLAIAYGVRDMYRDAVNTGVSADSLPCDDDGPASFWKHGDTFLRYIKQVKEKGVASEIEFNSNAGPKHPRFEVLNLQNGAWEKAGSWNIETGLTAAPDGSISFMGGRLTVNDFVSKLENKTLIIITALYEPFISMTTDDYNISDIQPHEVEGYCIDMLTKLAEDIGFQYRLYRLPGDKFGLKDPVTRKWNGMVQELIERNADIAVSGTTINQVREVDIDFTTPFIDLGLNFMMKVPDEGELRPFRFLDPLSHELWMHIIMTAVIVGVYVSFLNKLSPYDYHGGFVYRDNHQESLSRSLWRTFNRIKYQETSRLDLNNSILSSVSCLLMQGADHYSKSLSGRVTSVLWWMATVFIVATYTANLTSYLHAERVHTEINSVEDLAAQTKVTYGIGAGGSTAQFFMDSEVTLYRDMWYFMSTRGHLSSNDSDYMPRVRAGTHAQIGESLVHEFRSQQRPCGTIHSVGRIFGNMGFGFGLQKSSPYTEELSTHILQMRENGFLEKLYRKWFKERNECGGEAGGGKPNDTPAGQLQVSHMLGVFYVIYGGMIAGFMFLVVEFLAKSFQSVNKASTPEHGVPSTYGDAILMRWALFKKDFMADILPEVFKFNWLTKKRSGHDQRTQHPYENGRSSSSFQTSVAPGYRVDLSTIQDEVKCMH